MCLEQKDYIGSLKYLQECMEYAAKAVLMAYGMDYPKIHAVGRFLHEIERNCPQWFLEQIPAIAELAHNLVGGRPRFRYPFEHPPEEYESVVEEVLPKVQKALESCHKLVKQLLD